MSQQPGGVLASYHPDPASMHIWDGVARKMRGEFRDGATVPFLAENYPVSLTHIRRILARSTWRHLQ